MGDVWMGGGYVGDGVDLLGGGGKIDLLID